MRCPMSGDVLRLKDLISVRFTPINDRDSKTSLITKSVMNLCIVFTFSLVLMSFHLTRETVLFVHLSFTSRFVSAFDLCFCYSTGYFLLSHDLFWSVFHAVMLLLFKDRCIN